MTENTLMNIGRTTISQMMEEDSVKGVLREVVQDQEVIHVIESGGIEAMITIGVKSFSSTWGISRSFYKILILFC